MSWYLEAWQPEDGLAFAGSRDSTGSVQEAVLLAAPSFNPQPIRDVATASWATRGAFQEGVFDVTRPRPTASQSDPAFHELEFPTLEKCTTLVRRAYVASGPLSQPPPSPSSPVAPQGPPSSPAAALAYQAIRDEIVQLETADHRHALASNLVQLSCELWYREQLRWILVEALARMPAASASQTPSLQVDEDRVAFAFVLARSGLWEGAGGVFAAWGEAAERAELAAPVAFETRELGRALGAGIGPSARMLDGLLFRVPCPLAISPPYGRGLWSLGHHLCAAMADRGYLSRIADMQGVAIVHASAWLVCAGACESIQEPPLARAWCSWRVADWLAASVADRSLADVPQAERWVAQIVESHAREHEQRLQAVELAAEKERQRVAREELERVRAEQEATRKRQEREAAQREAYRAAEQERQREGTREREHDLGREHDREHSASRPYIAPAK